MNIIQKEKIPTNNFIQENVQISTILDFNSIERLTFIQYKPDGTCLFYDPRDGTRLERITIKIDKKNVQQQLSLYSWRKSTYFPIFKIKYGQIISQEVNNLKINIYHQVCDVKLGQLSDIPLNQAIYLLKEAVIGFQRLFSLFGAFQITPNMICTNQKGQCKVWLNQRFQVNSFLPSSLIQFQQLRKIKTIISARVLRTKTAIDFFQQLHQAKNIIELLDFIQQFVKIRKIQVPTLFSLISYSVLRNTVQRFHNNHPLNDVLSSLSKSSLKKRMKNCKSSDDKSSYTQQMPEKLISTQKLFSKNTVTANLVDTEKLNPYYKFNASSTTKISNNTTKEYSLKANYSINNLIDDKDDRKISEIKVRKASLKNMTNSYQIRQGFEEQPFSRYFSSKKLQKYDIQPLELPFQQNMRKITPISSKIIEDQQQQQSAKSSDQGIDTSEIYRKNGWSTKIEGIFTKEGPVKHSIKIGKQINPQNQKHQFSILKPPGLVYQSILPDEQNE